jgi:hypothetical protein
VSALSPSGHELRGDGKEITSSRLAVLADKDGCGLGIAKCVT